MHWFLTTAVPSLVASVVAQPANGASLSDNEDDFTNLFIGLHPADHDHFEKTLYEISDPHHKRYGQHLSGAGARALLQPHPGVTEDVKRWLLQEHDVGKSSIEDCGGYLQARVPVHKATSLSKRTSAGFDQVPENIRRHISHIQLMDPEGYESRNKRAKRANVQMNNIRSRRTTREERLVTRDDGFDPDPDLEVCKETLTPACVFKLYNVDSPPAHPESKTLYGIAGFRGVSETCLLLQVLLLTLCSKQLSMISSRSSLSALHHMLKGLTSRRS